MRISVVLRQALALLALASPVLLSAQFQPPTDEELKMTADPKAPGAAAVYLYREETTDDTLHYHSYYERIKILTEKGKEQATIHIPYEHGQFKVTDIVGRTIHPDGTIVPLTTKPTDLVDVKNAAYQYNTMVFTLPSAEVGSILEYRLELRYDDTMVVSPTWYIQQPFFVHKAHYLFKPAPPSTSHFITDGEGRLLDHLMYAAISLPLTKIVRSNAGLFTLDLTDIPATPQEDWMPPLNTIKQRVEFYYTYASTGKDFWDSEGKRWAKNVERFTNPKNELKTAVAGIVAPSDTDEQKARKIYAAVMKLDNTDFSRKKSEAEIKEEKIKPIQNAEDVWKQQSGTGDDIALLYVALARAAGLKVWPMQVVDRTHAFFDINYLRAHQLDDYIAVIILDGKDVFLDPGQKMCPFGLLNWKHDLATGFRLTETGATLATTPANRYADAAERRVAMIDIDPQGAVSGTVSIVMNGPSALHWRQMALRNDAGELGKRFKEFVQGLVPDGVEPEFDHFVGLDDPSVNLLAVLKVSGNLGTVTGKRVFLPGMFFESRNAHPFVAQEQRTIPVDVHYAKKEIDEVTYHLPPAFTVESSPQKTDLTWPDHALFLVRSSAKENTIEVTRAVAYNYTILDSKEYKDLRDFYLKIASADQQQIVLQRASAQGN